MMRQRYFIPEILFLVMIFFNQLAHVSCDSANFSLSLEDDIIETYVNTGNKPLHLEMDRFVAGNILFSDCCSLLTTDGNQTHVIVGPESVDREVGYREGNGTTARFHSLRGFVQLNETAVIVVDDHNDCLRLVDRQTNQTSVYAGKCTQPGGGGGSFLNASFNQPQQIIVDDFDPTSLLLTEAGNQVVRKLDTASDRVWTFSPQFAGRPSGIVQLPLTGDLFVSEISRVSRLFRSNRKIEIIAGFATQGTTPRGWLDGPFSQVMFFLPQKIVLISNGTKLLVADEHNQRIRVLDLITNTSSSIGSGFPAHDDGLLSNCTLFQPYSLMVANDAVYVGVRKGIRVIRNQQPELHTLATKKTETSSTTSPLHGVTPTEPQPCTGAAVYKILITSGVVIVTVSIVIVIGVLVYKLKIRSAGSGDNSTNTSSTNMSWNDLKDDATYDEATSAPEDSAQGQVNVTGYENVAHTAGRHNDTDNDETADYERLESRASHVYTLPNLQ